MRRLGNNISFRFQQGGNGQTYNIEHRPGITGWSALAQRQIPLRHLLGYHNIHRFMPVFLVREMTYGRDNT
jgi:hypothetical protein